jgi:V/A-type H+-transporting ATPase subunit A
MDIGKIIKVSGPLVQAEGMKISKMFDVVRVGEEKLIGEIIRIEGDIASIQVYEETEGLKVGDPVFGTGQPLMVELGPGLLKNIFDGIQRPLSQIEKTGDFIVRGIDIPPLDRSIKWDFKPVVKKGDFVESGDIVGVVKETEIIEHRILVPYGVRGEIIDIKEGSFTVEEEIGRIKTENGEVPLYLMQKWPVRKPRPFKKRLTPDTPLVTGQRVIDTLFPILKGGTACIPGPFGSGKCVTGETSVFLSDGKICQIKEIYENFKNKGRLIKDGEEEIILLDKPINLISYYDGKLVHSESKILYRGKTKQIVKLFTSSGRIIEVTPSHKLFCFNHNEGRIEQKESIRINEGDFLVIPRFLIRKGVKKWKLQIFEIFENYRICEEEIIKEVKNVIRKVNKKLTLKQIAQKTGVSEKVLFEYLYRTNKPTLKFIKKLYHLAKLPLPEIKYIKGETNSRCIKIPEFFDENLGLFLGLIMSDGTLKKNSIRFYNNEEKILETFCNLTQNLFSVSPKRNKTKSVIALNIESSVISHLLKYFSFPEYKKSRNLKVPDIIFKSHKKIIGNFLKGYFLCDGYFSKEKGEIEIISVSEKFAYDFGYLLSLLGIIFKITEKKVKDSVYYRILIRGYDEIRKFYKFTFGENKFEKYRAINEYLNENKNRYQRCDVIPLSANFWQRIYNESNIPYSELKKSGIEIFNYKMGEKITFSNFKKITKLLNNPYLIKLAENCLSHFYTDRIVKKEIINTDSYVYDLQVEKYHNFVGGNLPCLLHNTVVLHQIAKWADSEVVIYIGCGERGNEMADVLIEFPKLKDPKSGRPLMERTCLIANTSNMPVAARESSIYTGVTIGEYFRDMGYSVALMADSTSRWAEALREISGRMEEMPGEEGYPAYLGTRVASFYERAGSVICLGKDDRKGSLSLLGAVSPPGGDLTDPVVQMTLRVVKVFWGLDDRLAYQRHFPAINWLTSYSLYERNIEKFVSENIAPDFMEIRAEAISLLEKEAELIEIVRLVGMETLSLTDRLILEVARSIREDFLHQSAFDEMDAYTTLKKQYLMIKTIILFYRVSIKAIEKGKLLDEIIKHPVRQEISRMKYSPENKLEEILKLQDKIINLF